MSFNARHQRFRCETCGKLIAKEKNDFCNNCGCACHTECKEKHHGFCKTCVQEGVLEYVQPSNR